MSKYAHDSVVPYDHSDLDKKQQVRSMFNHISGRYDLVNRVLSGGTDIIWRKKALRELRSINPSTLLDVATGTGDVAIMAHKHFPQCKITGIDISEGMLDVGVQKIKAHKLENSISLIKGDSEAINFPDNAFDSVIVAFGVRNFHDLEKGLTEMRRVLRPGGKMVILEFSKPRHLLVKPVYGFYMNVMAPLIGKLFSKNKKAYSYLNQSIKKFPEGTDLIELLKNTGFREAYHKPLSFGICTIYCGIK